VEDVVEGSLSDESPDTLEVFLRPLVGFSFLPEGLVFGTAHRLVLIKALHGVEVLTAVGLEAGQEILFSVGDQMLDQLSSTINELLFGQVLSASVKSTDPALTVGNWSVPDVVEDGTAEVLPEKVLVFLSASVLTTDPAFTVGDWSVPDVVEDGTAELLPEEIFVLSAPVKASDPALTVGDWSVPDIVEDGSTDVFPEKFLLFLLLPRVGDAD